jgi:phthiocerol/phenolphthiocerol synthesis type-I polyketide synthase C
MRRNVDSLRAASPIAIVGAACRFPGADGLEAFWGVLDQGRDVVTEVPDGRWSKDFHFHPDPAQPGKSYTWSAGVLDDVTGFDAAFFGISPREAEQIDPQQRLLLELAWEALEDAGAPASRLSGQACGVYVGLSGAEYANARFGDAAGGDAHFMTGTTASIAANRLSYVLDLHGPSLVVDTACSSSLVAFHLACEAIRRGEVAAALVGGVNLLLSPYPFIGFCRASMLSPSGRCFAFDVRANGYVRGEGGAVVLLKPLAKAIADGDRVRAVVLGDGVNSDGRTVGISMPNARAQEALLSTVYADAGVGPEELDFVEAHGTGTQAGDPVEVAALGGVLGRGRSAPLPIGSVKTNIGHLETASGLAGMLKAVLAFERRRLPRSLHFHEPNPRLRLDEFNIEVAGEARALPTGRRLVAGVNSFGFGGTNAHVILASPPGRADAVANEDVLPPLLISARSQDSLRELAGRWSTALTLARDDAAAGALIRAAARGRDHHRYRLLVRGSARAGMAEAVLAEAGRRSEPAVGEGRIVYVFSGNGAQWAGMGLEAFERNGVFRDAVAEVDACTAPLTGWSVTERLVKADPGSVACTEIAQPLLFAIQVGVVRALRAEGVEPDACVGHSVGEIAAAWAAGRLDLEDACRIVVVRSREQERTRGAGKMAALGLGETDAAAALARLGLDLEIAAINSAAAVTVAGQPAEIARLGQAAEAEGWRFTALDLDYAFHSRVLDGIKAGVLGGLAQLSPLAGGPLLVSTVTGTAIESEALGAEYWWRNVRQPVRFATALDELIAGGHRLFAEIGPAPILQSYVREQLRCAGVEGRVMPSLTRQPGEGDPFPALAASAYANGYDLSRSAAFEGAKSLDGLPRYPWRRERFWARTTAEAVPLATPMAGPSLLGFTREPDGGIWTSIVDVKRLPWLADHAVEGAPVLPAAAMAEMALAAARARIGEGKALEVADLDIVRAMAFEPDRAREVRVRIGADQRLFIESRPRLGDEPWTLHASASVRACVATPPACPPFRTRRAVPGERIYALAAEMGLDYGPAFRTVGRVELARDEASAQVRFSAESLAAASGEDVLSPPLLDGALQGLFGLLDDERRPQDAALLPSRIGRLQVFAPLGRAPVEARLTLTRRGRRSASADVGLFDADGQAVAALRDCWLTAARLRRSASVKDRSYRFALLPSRRAHPAPRQLGEAARAKLSEPRQSEAPSEATVLLEAYLAAGAYAAVRAIAEPGTPIELTSLEERGALAGASAPLFARTLRFLAGYGLAEEGVSGWRVEPDSHLGAPEPIWRTLVGDHPELGLDLALAAEAIADLPEVFRYGARLGQTRLTDRLEQLRSGTLAFRTAVETLADEIAQLIEASPPGRTLRILEVGAGDGALARALASRLGDWPLDLGYVATEAGGDRTARLAASLPGAPQLQALDWTPGSSEPGPAGPFDLVVAAQGLAVASDAETALGALQERLADGGLMLLAEPEPSFLLDLLLGGDPEWWRGSLTPDFPVSPLRGGAEWARLAEALGLADLGSRPLPAACWPMSLLGLRREGAPSVVVASKPIALCVPPGGDPAIEAALFGAEGVSPGEDGDVVILPAPLSSADVAADAADRLAAVIGLVQEAVAFDPPRRCWIVTRGAHQAHGEAAAGACSGALVGVARTLANEVPGIDCRLLDLDPAMDADEAAAAILAEVSDPDEEREVVRSADGRWAVRLIEGLPEPPAAGGELELNVGRPGLLDTLEWRPAATGTSPKRDQVAIEVRAAGLNFRDVMWALGLLPEEALLDGFAGPTFGLECSGVIAEVGAGVEGLQPGDRVIAFAPSALGTRVVTAAHAVARLPDNVTFEAGATIPVAYLTAVYALGRLGELSAGERVLIHGAAGGVGLAAVQYAKHRGATVFATAGSPLKREFLRSFGADVVLDSRSLAFADEIERLTGGEGVDVVLNSLSGEAMERSLALLRPFGRFLELGKRDFYFGGRVGLRPFRQNIAYFGIDADQLPARKPELCRSVIGEFVELLGQGVLTPLPHRSFRREEAVDAFRLMQGSGHIGKLVLQPGAARPAPAAARTFEVRPDASYLVTGGLTGFGLETARWLADQGARHLVLLGRRGDKTPSAAEAAASLEAKGAAVRIFACDVADPAALEEVLRQVREGMPGLRGVVHAAMVVDDGLLSDLTPERLRTVLAPKLAGALNLDRLTEADPLDWLLLYSSATTVLGAPGQGGYVAANAALEAIARSRRARGLPAMAIAWGPISDAGFLAREDSSREALARRLAAAPMAAREALDAIPDLWASGEAVAAYASVQWAGARRSLPILRTPAFARFAGELSEAADEDIRDRLAGLGLAEATEVIAEALVQEVSRILGGASERIDPGRPLSEYGMDSLMAVELRLAIETRLGVNLPLLSLADGVSLSAMAGKIARSLQGEAPAAASIVDAAVRLESDAPFAASPPPGDAPLISAAE